MRFFLPSKQGIVIVAVLTSFFAQGAFGQEAQSQETQNPKAQEIREARGIPPRATPADYQAHAQAGPLTVAAEFTGHSVATPEAILSTEDYVVVEVGLFGSPQARTRLSFEDFSLRINEKKMPVPAQQYGLVFRSLKDPEWSPPVPEGSKSKTSIGSGGKLKNDDGTEVVIHVPIELQRAMQLRVQKAALPEGDRALPEAGLLFFPYRGKADSIHSIELIYAGPAGKATLALQP